MSEGEVLRANCGVLSRDPAHRANSGRLEEEVLIRYNIVIEQEAL